MTGCYRAPGTARDQVIFFSEEKELESGAERVSRSVTGSAAERQCGSKRVGTSGGRKIAEAANKPEYQWEFAVIQDDKMVNAFALPGGKVAIFTGILKHTKDDAGLATVMGHEVAHALQRHGMERMSRSIMDQIAQLGALGAAASGAVGRTDPRNTGVPGGTGGMSGAALQGLLAAYGVNFSLPFNRKQESEADQIGLLLMAKAGYDPREAVPFWERMSGCPRQMIEKVCFRSQQAVPEFLFHPSVRFDAHQPDRSLAAQGASALSWVRRRDASLIPTPYRPTIGPMQRRQLILKRGRCAKANRYQVDLTDRVRADCHWPGLRVRLFRHAGL